MTSKTAGWIVVAFVIGLAIPTLVIWNPAHWVWADSITGRAAQDSSTMPPSMNMNTNSSDMNSGKAAPKSERKIAYWRAPMDPTYIRNEPGKSPMGMDLIPVYEDEASQDTGIRVSNAFLQNFGVRTAVAERGPVQVNTRTTGALQYNDKAIVSVNTKFEGWIETAHVNYIGEPVKRGDVLFEIYSPQLVTTQQEYLATVQYLEKLREGGGTQDSIERAQALLEAARERLRYWDITEDQIDALHDSGKITRTLKIFSPVSGIVSEKMGDTLEGMRLTPGMSVYKIADLSKLWVEVEVYEDQIQFARLGQSAKVTIDAYPGKVWNGKIVYLNPAMNTKTRTLTAYVEIDNPDESLRPEMYANVELGIPSLSGVVRIPTEAVIHTGETSLVIVQKDTGLFEPRQVEVGSIGGGYQEIRSGLSPGEVVVTSSQFLIDSESNLREAVSEMLSDSSSGGAGTSKGDMAGMDMDGSTSKGSANDAMKGPAAKGGMKGMKK